MKKYYKAERSVRRGELTIASMSDEGRELLMEINGHNRRKPRLLERSSSGKYYNMPLALAELICVETIQVTGDQAKAPIGETLRAIDYWTDPKMIARSLVAHVAQLETVRNQLPESE